MLREIYFKIDDKLNFFPISTYKALLLCFYKNCFIPVFIEILYEK